MSTQRLQYIDTESCVERFHKIKGSDENKLNKHFRSINDDTFIPYDMKDLTIEEAARQYSDPNFIEEWIQQAIQVLFDLID